MVSKSYEHMWAPFWAHTHLDVTQTFGTVRFPSHYTQKGSVMQ